jgi:undecaprenyl-diphosphatase
LLLGRAKAARIIFLIAAIGLITGGAATLLRSVIGRTRPNAHTTQGFYGPRHDSHWNIGKYEFSSFPSGHAATVVGLAAAAWMLHRRLGIVAAGYATLVSWSRIAQGSHHFSDVIAAAILGIWGAYWILTRAGPWLLALKRFLVRAALPSRAGIAASGHNSCKA